MSDTLEDEFTYPLSAITERNQIIQDLIYRNRQLTAQLRADYGIISGYNLNGFFDKLLNNIVELIKDNSTTPNNEETECT